MSRKLEHDYYISGCNLTEVNSMENPESYKLCTKKSNVLKTELSLGLPGSESPERKPNYGGVTIFGKDFEGKGQTLGGAKRVFSDAIDGCEKWVLSINGGSEGKLGKDGVLFGGGESKSGAQKLGVLNEGNGTLSANNKGCVEEKEGKESAVSNEHCGGGGAPAAKAQVVGWPPIRSFRKNTMASTLSKNNGNTEEKSVAGCLYVKVSMDGAPYLRKIDLQIYRNYMELSSAVEKMFTCFITGQCRSHGHGKQDGNEGNSTEYLRTSEYVLTYEDKDGDWMLVGDVPWKMFTENCKKLRIMKGSEAIGLAPFAGDKCKIQAY